MDPTPRSLSHRDAHRRPRMPDFRTWALRVARRPESPIKSTYDSNAHPKTPVAGNVALKVANLLALVHKTV